ncbi:hypothetical protein FOZ62_013559, partial [Perkinsus olseni]
RIQGRHTASNLAGELMDTITEAEIGDRICSVTTWVHYPRIMCGPHTVGHKLHLTVTNGLGLWSGKTIDDDETKPSQQTDDSGSSSDEDGDPDDILAEAESDSDAEDIDELPF